MTNPNDPAFSVEHKVNTNSSDPTGPCIYDAIGLTKREYFAGMAMQGFLAGRLNDASNSFSIEVLTAKAAVIMADALIVELSKVPTEK